MIGAVKRINGSIIVPLKVEHCLGLLDPKATLVALTGANKHIVIHRDILHKLYR